MKIFILAAGRGSRLHPYTAECPKCLTELGGMTLIERQLATLRQAVVNDITIVTGYRAEMLALPGTRQMVNADWETTNMVESLFAAEADFGDDVIVAYSDIVYEPKVIQALLNAPSDISVIVDRSWRTYWEHRFVDPLSDAESLRIDNTGRIIDIGNKVSNIDDIEAQYIGLMRFQGAGIEALRKARESMRINDRAWKAKRPFEKAYMTDLLMELIITEHDVTAVPIDHGWLEIDTTEDFEITNQMFADGSISRFFDPKAIV
jgi:choline kinase